MTDEAKSLNQQLSSDCRLKVLRALGWNEVSEEDANPEGWISNLDDQNLGWQFSVNIKNGTVTDHQNGYSMDIVGLVWCYAEYMEGIESSKSGAIKWIKQTLGISDGSFRISEHQKRAKDVIGGKLDKYAQIPNNVWKNPKLSSSAVRVWIAIQERCGKGKHCSWAGYNKLAKDTGLARNTIVDAIKQLIEEGYLVELDRGKGLAPKRYPMCNFKDYTNN